MFKKFFSKRKGEEDVKETVEVAEEVVKDKTPVAAEEKEEPLGSVADVHSKLARLAQNVPEVDLQSGLAFCADDEEIYWSSLEDFATDDLYDNIANTYETKNWGDYQIYVHGLKSAAKTLGFMKLSEDAKGLEFAAKDGNIDHIEGNTYRVQKNFEMIRKVIQEML